MLQMVGTREWPEWACDVVSTARRETLDEFRTTLVIGDNMLLVQCIPESERGQNSIWTISSTW